MSQGTSHFIGGSFAMSAITAAYANLYAELQYHGKNNTENLVGEILEEAIYFDGFIPGNTPVTGESEAIGNVTKLFVLNICDSNAKFSHIKYVRVSLFEN